jgi:hypothetical protein
MNAEAARMLKPERLPEIPEPLAVPRAKERRPYKLKVGPKAFTPGYNPTADIIGGLGSAVGSLKVFKENPYKD